MAQYTIPASNLGWLDEKLASLNKRAVKLGTAPISYKVVGSEIRTKHAKSDPLMLWDPIPYKVLFVEVEGKAPKLQGWSFVAKVEPHEAGNIVKLLPGETWLPDRFYTSAMDCDHCKKARRRNEVFVVKHEDGGTYWQIGRQCLADFLGGKSPETLASMAEWDIESGAIFGEAEGYGGGTRYREDDTLSFLAMVAAVTRRTGFVSRSKARDTFAQATADEAWGICTDPKEAADFSKHYLQEGEKLVDEQDIVKATKALAWVRDELEAGENNYLRNLKVACASDSVDYRGAGIVASAISAYIRATEVKAEQAAPIVRSYVGTVGEKLTVKVKIVSIREFPSDYGYNQVRVLFRMEDEKGNVITWWTSDTYGMEEGQEVTITGKVKQHETYKDIPQTVLTRCKFSELVVA